MYRRRRIINEDDLDREMDEERERALRQFDDSEEESSANEEEEDWKKPSAYSLLMSSLKKNSKQQDFYKKIQLEQEGIEGQQEDDEELEEDDEGLEEDVEEEDGDEEEEEDEDEAEPIDGDAAEPYQEEDEEIVYMGSDAEEEEEISGDLFEDRFADQQPGSFDEAIAIVEQKKWIPQAFKDDVLHDVTAFTTTKNDSIKDMPIIENLEDVKVKQRVAKCWPKANKDIFKKGIIDSLKGLNKKIE